MLEGAGAAASSTQGGEAVAQRGFEAIEPSPATTLVPRLVWEGNAPTPR